MLQHLRENCQDHAGKDNIRYGAIVVGCAQHRVRRFTIKVKSHCFYSFFCPHNICCVQPPELYDIRIVGNKPTPPVRMKSPAEVSAENKNPTIWTCGAAAGSGSIYAYEVMNERYALLHLLKNTCTHHTPTQV